MTDPYIESFIRAFEDGSLSKSEWTHSRHLVMALWHLRHHDRDEATSLIRDGIQRFNERDGNLTGYPAIGERDLIRENHRTVQELRRI